MGLLASHTALLPPGHPLYIFQWQLKTENCHWKICTSVVNNNQFFHVLGTSVFARVFMYLYWSWSASLWISVLKRGEIHCWSFRELGLTSGNDSLHPQPSGWESVIPLYLLVLLSVTSVIRSSHPWPHDNMGERTGGICCSLFMPQFFCFWSGVNQKCWWSSVSVCWRVIVWGAPGYCSPVLN